MTRNIFCIVSPIFQFFIFKCSLEGRGYWPKQKKCCGDKDCSRHRYKQKKEKGKRKLIRYSRSRRFYSLEITAAKNLLSIPLWNHMPKYEQIVIIVYTVCSIQYLKTCTFSAIFFSPEWRERIFFAIVTDRRFAIMTGMRWSKKSRQCDIAPKTTYCTRQLLFWCYRPCANGCCKNHGHIGNHELSLNFPIVLLMLQKMQHF